MMRQRRFVVVAAVLLSLPSFAGCFKATGGGKLTGMLFHPGSSITTGFQMRCDNVGSSGIVTGQFQYHDHGSGVAFHADINQSLGNLTCEALDQLAADPLVQLQGTFITFGTYTPQPKNLGEGGQVQITIQDQNATFPFVVCPPGITDSLVVTIPERVNDILNGVFHGYLEQGCLDKGNFTVFVE